MNTYRIAFYKTSDDIFYTSEFIKANSNRQAELKVQETYNVSKYRIVSSSLWKKNTKSFNAIK